ncbi:MAG: hydrogen gas-evolving membrane-bound hydrogenase subunit E [Opitutales bacterium]
MLLAILPLSLIVAGLLAPLLEKVLGKWLGVVLGVVPLAAFAWFAAQVGGDPVSYQATWFGTLGVNADFRLMGMGHLMALLITGIGFFISLYASGYLGGHALRGYFFVYLYAFMGAMLGIVVADNIYLLFVFWELTSITSYLLIGFNHKESISRWKALQALLVTGLGGLALLAGLILLANAMGTARLSEMLAQGVSVANHPHYLAILILVVLGAFTKSAQVPFHFWLPNAMAAPTPVSAFLHSATMVKAGVYLLAVLHPLLGGTIAWEGLLVTCGMITMLAGALIGLFQTDLKRILAFTTLSVLGLLTMLLGVGTDLAVKSAVIFLFGHALYKAALFMVAGSIDHEAGTREVTSLAGLRRAMPLTAAAGALAALSKGGFPPFFGFLGKEYVYKAGLGLEWLQPLVLGSGIAANMLLLALAFKVGFHPFWGKKQTAPKDHVHEAPWTMLAGPIGLAIAGLTFGALPKLLASPIIEPAVFAVAGHPVEFKLVLWQGFNLPLLLSVVTLAGGLTIFFLRERIWRQTKAVHEQGWRGFDGIYERCFNGLVALAKWQTGLLQSGYLRNYLIIILGTAVTLISIQLWRVGGLTDVVQMGTIRLHEGILIVIMIGATLGALFARALLSTLLSLGVVGLGVALIFALFGAPDLAITQVLVESLTVVLFALAVYKLPRFKIYSQRRTLIGDAIFALLCGIAVTLLVLKANYIQLSPTISTELGQWSYPLAKGKNVVNVILVDFRAIDTLGEIAVLAVAALGIASLLRFRPRKEAADSST